MPDMADLNDIYAAIQTALRSIGAEIESPWFYYQLGLLLAAGAARLLAVAVRSRIDFGSSAMGLPAAFRLFFRTLLGSLTIAFFVLLSGLLRTAMLLMTWPSRSYLLSTAAALATAWLV